ncbi:transposase [Hahella sp. KA22]|uniref:transposase n=1 Tax=Hahella sp. KA22 TaxID=1628392 RepID=UPI000FDD8C66|nr:transposase [Hahella sp. KA22]AZZ92599.1 transposase [Hahella sp. KA22]QAY55972.1 transposase [Hahella sp. KA22]
MPKPRNAQISVEATPFYHCISRCVRQAYLCGQDTDGRDYSHRRKWVESRILFLSSVFAMDVCAYAVMSNHFHVVLHVNASNAASWSDREVVRRWNTLFTGTELSWRYLRGEPIEDAHFHLLKKQIAVWRQRLACISWFMRCLNEPIARMANREDGCTGRFWEGRFKSQALLDEKALLACLAYVDLNPVRANLARTPEGSQYTSIQRRINALKSEQSHQPAKLMPFTGSHRNKSSQGIPFALDDYLALVDWTGRAQREDKPGYIHQSYPPILQRLNFDPNHWLTASHKFESHFRGWVGAFYRLKSVCAKLGYKRIPGGANARLLLV